MELGEGDAGLEDDVPEILIVFEDPIHPAQVNGHRTGVHGCGHPEAMLHAAADRVERKTVAIGNRDDALDFLHAGR